MAKAKPASELPRTVEAFDRWHAEQPEQWEFVDGRPVRRALQPLRHTAIKGNIFTTLHDALRGSDQRVLISGLQITAPELSTVPDVVVVPEASFRTADRLMPTLLVEVGVADPHRWRGYSCLPKLRHYLVVADTERQVVLFTRRGELDWEELVVRKGLVPLRHFGTTLLLDEIYGDVVPAADPDA